MKKNFLFGLLALMLAWFWFGGVSMAAGYVATIGNNCDWESPIWCYTDLTNAINAAEDGQTVTLLADWTIASNIVLSKNLTINVNGFKINNEWATNSIFQVIDGKTLTIDGSVKWSTVYWRINVWILTNNNGNVVLNWGTYWVWNWETVLHINGTCLDSNVTIKNATITSTNDNGIQLNGAGTFLIENSTIKWKTAVYLKAWTLTVKGSKLQSTATSHSNYSYNWNGSNPTWDSVVVDSCAYPGSVSIKNNPNLILWDNNTIIVENNSNNKQIWYYEANTDKEWWSMWEISSKDGNLTLPGSFKWIKDGDVYKIWYTVKFNCGDNCEVNDSSVLVWKRIEKPADPVENKTVIWFKENTHTNEWNFDDVVHIADVDSENWNITLYGEFRTPVTVTFMDGETELTDLKQTIATNTKAIKPEDPTKYGYTFLWWFKWNETSPFNFGTAIAENTTLTAKWHQKSTLSTNIWELDFEVWVPVEFTFTAAWYDDKNIMVKWTSKFSNAGAIDSLEYFEVNQVSCWNSYDTEAKWCWLPLVWDHFGPAAWFSMPEQPFSSKFRVTFNKAWEYSFTASMKKVDGDSVLCDTEVTFTVNPKTYTIILDSTVSNWTISTTPADKAAEWTEITLTATPASNYKLWSWTVKAEDDTTVTVTNNKFTMPAKNVTVSATFTAKSSGGSSSWGGGSSRKTETKADNAKATTWDTAKVDEQKTDESKADESKADETKTSEEAKAAADAQALKDGYSQEFIDAYNFARKNNITTKDTIREADMDAPLTRIAMAKMLSQYAINVLWKTPDTTKVVPAFPDVSAQLDADYDNGVTLAYQLWIMWIWIENFRPFAEVTRAEFGTALSRMLFCLEDGEWNEWYSTHLAQLIEEKIITNDNPNLKELRGYVMIMLMRSAQ